VVLALPLAALLCLAPAEGQPEGEAEVVVEAQKPPRIDGPYLGLVMYGGISAIRVNEFSTPGAFGIGGGYIRFGQMVFPWLGLGLQGGGNGGVGQGTDVQQTVGQGALLVDFTFVPAPKRVQGLSLRASFGFGGGAVRRDGIDGRSGFGGAFFGAGARYEFFPGASRYRATKGGGFGLGPEIAWLGATPAARGRPMANTVYLGLAMTFYFGD
jgi:hypothetical protein